MSSASAPPPRRSTNPSAAFATGESGPVTIVEGQLRFRVNVRGFPTPQEVIIPDLSGSLVLDTTNRTVTIQEIRGVANMNGKQIPIVITGPKGSFKVENVLETMFGEVTRAFVTKLQTRQLPPSRSGSLVRK
jgi:hypothetical protein